MLARFLGAWGPAQRLKCWSEDGTPPLMELYSSAFGNHPRPPKVSGLGVMVAFCLRRNKKLKTWFAGSQAVRVAGSRPQGPVGQVSRGLGARAPRAWGPAVRGWGLFPNLSNYDFFANLLVGAWRRRGCRLKRLLRRWGPGGKRSRDTPPTPPPPTLSAFWGCKGERKATIQHAPQGRRTLNPKP